MEFTFLNDGFHSDFFTVAFFLAKLYFLALFESLRWLKLDKV